VCSSDLLTQASQRNRANIFAMGKTKKGNSAKVTM
jgi:hypothetical protein